MNQKVIDALNAARSAELTAILQYMAHHYELEDQQYGKLASKMKEIAIVEMRHAEALAERILYLGGVPTYKPDQDIKKGQGIPEMLTTDKALEDKAIQMYNESANMCAAENDLASKDLFEKLIADEEQHEDFFDGTKNQVDSLGAPFIATLTDLAR